MQIAKGSVVSVRGQDYTVHIPPTPEVDMLVAYRHSAGQSVSPRVVFDVSEVESARS